MIFVFGGREMGKLKYAKGIFAGEPLVCDLKNSDIKAAFNADIIMNLQEAVKSMLNAGEEPVKFFKENIDSFKDKIMIGDEIGCGIVPVDEFERRWRDETGWLYQFLAGKADKVVRIWAGIEQILKN